MHAQLCKRTEGARAPHTRVPPWTPRKMVLRFHKRESAGCQALPGPLGPCVAPLRPHSRPSPDTLLNPPAATGRSPFLPLSLQECRVNDSYNTLQPCGPGCFKPEFPSVLGGRCASGGPPVIAGRPPQVDLCFVQPGRFQRSAVPCSKHSCAGETPPRGAMAGCR